MCGIKAYTLDPATLTASANDYGFETVFSRWLEVVGEPNDLLIALSGSGKSANILWAIKLAQEIGMKIITFPTNNDLKKSTPRTQERHLRMIHQIWELLKH